MTSNVDFSSGPSKSPFSMYSTSNSILMKNPYGYNKPIDPLKKSKRTGFFNNQGIREEKHIADEVEKQNYEDHPDFRSTYKSGFVKEGTLHGVLKEHDEMKVNLRNNTIKGAKTGYKSNSNGFELKDKLTSSKGTTLETYKPIHFDMDHPEIKRIIEPGKHRKYPNCGFLHAEKGPTTNTRGMKLSTDTTYRTLISKNDHFFSDEVPKVPAKRMSPSFIKSEIPACEVSRINEENLKKFELERKNKMHPTILRRMEKTDRILHDDITQNRGRFVTSNDTFFDEKDPMSQKSGKKFSTSFAGQVHTDTRLFKGFDNKEERQRFERYYKGDISPVERRFVSSGFQKNVSDGGYFKDPEFSNISDTLVYDQRKVETFHPTIAAMMKTRHPSSYGNAVPTYQHKRRNISN